MKKIFTLISILSVSVAGLWAQATPNPGFENWTTSGFPSYDTPDNWDNANPSTAITGVVTCIKATAAADIHSGSAAVKLVTKQIPAPFNQIVPGIVTTGTINTSTQTIDGGIPYTLNPDSIVGWYKYTPQGGENGFVSFYLFGSAPNNADTVAKASFSTPASTVSAYTRFAAPLVYLSANAVANSIWLLASSNNNALASSIGSTLFADDLALVINPTTAENELNKVELSVGPNPVVGRIEIKNESEFQTVFVLYDVTGRNVAREEIQKGTTAIYVTDFPAGLYSYSLSTANNVPIKNGKLIIQK